MEGKTAEKTKHQMNEKVHPVDDELVREERCIELQVTESQFMDWVSALY